MPERFPENAQGDFYVENQACTACGAPQFAAPDLIDHSKREYGHCFFKKQPQTPEEIGRAIHAMKVSCVGGIRYGGKNEAILQRLYNLGLEKECDHLPNYLAVAGLRNKVRFTYAGTVKELYERLIMELGVDGGHISDFSTNTVDRFEFTYTPASALAGNQFVGNFSSVDNYEIELRSEQHCILITTIRNADKLEEILRNNQKVSEILWRDTNGNVYIGGKPSDIKYTGPAK